MTPLFLLENSNKCSTNIECVSFEILYLGRKKRIWFEVKGWKRWHGVPQFQLNFCAEKWKERLGKICEKNYIWIERMIYEKEYVRKGRKDIRKKDVWKGGGEYIWKKDTGNKMNIGKIEIA